MSTMVTLKYGPILLVATILAVCRGEGEKASCKIEDVAQVFFKTFDGTHSENTGNTDATDYALRPPSDNLCKDPATLKYRTYDGTCNNIKNYGAAFTPLGNLLKPAYDDDISIPRQRGENGEPLPGAREISLKLLTNVSNPAEFPIILMQWGQHIAHDYVLTASPSGRRNCCGLFGGCPPFIIDINCQPIPVPPNDPIFDGICSSFVRSLAANTSNKCSPRFRQQINAVTHYLDASQIYGSSDETAAAVREKGGYLLRTSRGNLLPEDPNANCVKNSPEDYCFLAGDSRVNQHPYLAALTTIFVREHNRIAKKLRALSPFTPAETIFQITRKLIIAIQQVITYNDYLRITLGQDAERWGLTSTSGRSHYDPSVNPSILTSFSSAAFRLHTTIPSRIAIGARLVLLRDLFNNVREVIRGFTDVVAGMVGVASASERRMESFDQYMVSDVTQFLFMNPTTKKGLDLAAINVQRGRDHGLPPYHIFRVFCGLPPPKGFDDEKVLGPYVRELGKVYSSVKDIDLFVGMLYETKEGDGTLGPTASCLQRIQYSRTKYGDRFFYDNNNPMTAFTDVQLTEIRKYNLTYMLCNNANLQGVPMNAFRFESSSNPLVNCATLRLQDLNWALFIPDPTPW